MILDRIENGSLYYNLNPLFADAFRFLQTTDLQALELGKHEIQGTELYAIAAKDPAREVKDAQLEAHRKYIDIQLCLDSVDWIGWRAISDCIDRTADYDTEKDVEFFADAPDVWVPARIGYFALFFPHDTHMPLIGDGVLHKVVVKVRA